MIDLIQNYIDKYNINSLYEFIINSEKNNRDVTFSNIIKELLDYTKNNNNYNKDKIILIYINKYKFDSAQNYIIDFKYNSDPEIFKKLLNQTNINNIDLYYQIFLNIPKYNQIIDYLFGDINLNQLNNIAHIFYLAIENKIEYVVKKILEAGVSANINYLNKPIISYVIKHINIFPHSRIYENQSEINILKLFFEYKADINIKISNKSLFQIALSEQKIKICELLIINKIDIKNSIPLYPYINFKYDSLKFIKSIMYNYLNELDKFKIIEDIKNNNIESIINSIDTCEKCINNHEFLCYGLKIAIKNKNLSLIKTLISYSYNGIYDIINDNIYDINGQTPLIIAIKNNYNEIIKYLMKNNVNISIKDNYNKSAIDYAYELNNYHIIRYLDNFSDNLINIIKYENI